MRTISLEDGKYEFDRDDQGLLVAARRNGLEWLVGTELAHAKAFNAALNEIEQLSDALSVERAAAPSSTEPIADLRAAAPSSTEPIADLRAAITDLAQRYANQHKLVLTDCHIGWIDISTVERRVYAVDSVGMRVATKP